MSLAGKQQRFTRLLKQGGQTVTIGGTEYPCARTIVRRETLRLNPGELDSYDFSVHVSAETLAEGSLPETDALATFAGSTYYILAYQLDGPGVGYLIHLGSD